MISSKELQKTKSRQQISQVEANLIVLGGSTFKSVMCGQPAVMWHHRDSCINRPLAGRTQHSQRLSFTLREGEEEEGRRWGLRIRELGVGLGGEGEQGRTGVLRKSRAGCFCAMVTAAHQLGVLGRPFKGGKSDTG